MVKRNIGAPTWRQQGPEAVGRRIIDALAASPQGFVHVRLDDAGELVIGTPAPTDTVYAVAPTPPGAWRALLPPASTQPRLARRGLQVLR